MNKQKQTTIQGKNDHRSAIQAWTLYLLALAAWVPAVLLMVFLGMVICSNITWYATDPLYQLLYWVRDYIVFVCAAVVLIGWVVISYFFITRPYRQMQILVAAADQLAHPTEEPIQLPAAMQNVEDQLNLIREQALWDARTARDAEQRKNDLVVYLAHDLKTPLTSVIGYLTLLRDEPQISPELRSRYTGIALEKAERLEDLVNEFFDITRFSLTHLELERRDTDLKRMLQQMCSEFEPVLAQQQLTVSLDLPETLHVVCDADKMARVFDNLLNNACHYAYPASTIFVRAWLEKGHVTITFRNAGATIPPEKLSRMFEQFFRLDSSRGSRTGNAGLGLAIAREIVSAHGGAITAQSAQEQITFTVTLPL